MYSGDTCIGNMRLFYNSFEKICDVPDLLRIL